MQPIEYRDIDAVSQSRLTLLASGPKYLRQAMERAEMENTYEVFNRNFDIGSYVDMALTGGDVSIFTALENPIPDATTNPGKIVKHIIQNDLLSEIPTITEKSIETLVMDVADVIGVGGKDWSHDRIKTSLESKGVDTFALVKEIAEVRSRGQVIIDSGDLTTAKNCVTAIQHDPHVGEWFYQYPGEELVFQYLITFELLGVKCKSLIDVVRVNHDTKLIQVGDLKTTELKNISSFASPHTFLRYRLDLQADFYMLGIVKDPMIADLLKSGYILDPVFYFLPVSKTSLATAVVEYQRREDRMADVLYNGNTYPGIRKLLTDYKFHVNENQWDHPADFYKTNSYFVSI